MAMLRTIAAVAAFGLGSITAGQSAQAQATCDWYANTALQQQKVNVDRKCGLKGESWSFDPSTLEFATVADPIDRMLAIDRWASQHQLPRFMFYKIPEEQKPCFVDLESPHFVDLMAHLVRKSSRISFSEMLPAPDDLWLADRNGARYASELRIVAVDPRQWSLP